MNSYPLMEAFYFTGRLTKCRVKHRLAQISEIQLALINHLDKTISELAILTNKRMNYW